MDTRARRHARSAPQNFHTLYDLSPALPSRNPSLSSSLSSLPLFLNGSPPSSRPVFILLPSSTSFLSSPSFLLHRSAIGWSTWSGRAWRLFAPNVAHVVSNTCDRTSPGIATRREGGGGREIPVYTGKNSTLACTSEKQTER